MNPNKINTKKVITGSIGCIVRGFKIGVTKWFRQNMNINIEKDAAGLRQDEIAKLYGKEKSNVFFCILQKILVKIKIITNFWESSND